MVGERASWGPALTQGDLRRGHARVQTCVNMPEHVRQDMRRHGYAGQHMETCAGGPVPQGREQIKQEQNAPRDLRVTPTCGHAGTAWTARARAKPRGDTHVPSPPERAPTCAPTRSPGTRMRRWLPRAAGAPRVSGRLAFSRGHRLRPVRASSTQVWLGGIPWEGSGPNQNEPVEPALLFSGLKLLHPAHGFPCVWVRGSRTRLHIPQPGASWGVPQRGVGSVGRGLPGRPLASPRGGCASAYLGPDSAAL